MSLLSCDASDRLPVCIVLDPRRGAFLHYGPALN
jgi:hypothetical protein